MTCTCGYSDTETADHELTYSPWEVGSESEHFRTGECDCGYSAEETEQHYDGNYDGNCDGCGYITYRFSVTLPAVMHIVVDEDGKVYTASNAEIVNNSSDRIVVESVTVTAGEDWTLVPIWYDMADEKVDARCIGFYLNGMYTTSIGESEILKPSKWWIVDRDASCMLEYDAVVSATSEAIRNEQVLTLVFVVDWLYL